MAPTRFISPTALVEALLTRPSDSASQPLTITLSGVYILNILTVQPGRSEIGDQRLVAEIFEVGCDFEIFTADKLNDALQFVFFSQSPEFAGLAERSAP